ncbi:OmpP1/FadL family transporter [uncultured Aquitalea sp.]|uniref:OmpP1/FadL family transporter n=1 Tax=uncultured Aquitalea sp. TaxID=540272 RepID=UPI0025E79E50|nr:OmpP1/FadL family transporter [uncultured Aquitalea sp.]
MKLKHLSLSVMIMGSAAGLYATGAMASGYHFGSQSVSAQGTAFANGAEANDASTIFYNPAGMSRLQGNNFSGGLTVVIPDSEYTDKGSKHVTGAATGGNNGGSFAPSSVVAPSLYATHQVNDKVTVGLGIFVPFGAKLDYDSTWAGRYALQSISLETLNFNPSVAFKLDERNSVGVGVSAQYMKAKLSKAVDTAGGLGLLQSAAAHGSVAAQQQLAAMQRQLLALGMTPTQIQNALAAVQDGKASLEADGWGYGFNLGYMFQLDENTRFGLAYRSNIHHKLTGSATWDFSGSSYDPRVAALVGAASGHKNSDGSVTVDTPESISANAFHKLNDKIDLMADLTWTRHSRMDSIDIKFDGTTEGDLVIKQKWRDTYKLSLGMNYHYNDALTLRTGVAYDQSPVDNDNLRHPALPDSDRYWLSFGANYKLNKQSSIDFAYSYVFFKNADIKYTDGCNPLATTCTGNGETTVGSYKTNLQFVGLQYNYSF